VTSLLLVSGYQNVGRWRRALAEHLPEVAFAVWDVAGRDDIDPAEVSMIAIDDAPAADFFAEFPNLRCVQYLGHGISDVASRIAPDSAIALARLVDPGTTASMVEYCVGHVMRVHLRMADYLEQQRRGEWSRLVAPRAQESRVGVLGLGGIGLGAVDAFAHLGFDVVAWSRSPRELDSIDSSHGYEALPAFVGSLDHIVAILPETPQTTGLFDASLLAACKPGAHLLNVGRGSLVEPDALLAALDSGQLGAATLDVAPIEPLPAEHALWHHSGVTVTPHMAGGGSPTSAIETTVENYRRAMAGASLLHQWSRD